MARISSQCVAKNEDRPCQGGSNDAKGHLNKNPRDRSDVGDDPPNCALQANRDASQTATPILLPDGSRSLVLVEISFLIEAQPSRLRQAPAA